MKCGLKYVVARNRATSVVSKKMLAILTSKNKYLIGCNEPFIIQLGSDKSLSHIPLVKLFGPGYYWRVCGEPGDPAIVGEGENAWSNGNNRFESKVLELRRSGRIYGRWYSKFSPIGDWGDYLFDEVENITYLEYQAHISEFRSQHAKMDW